MLQFSLENRYKVIFLYEQGNFQAEISRRTGVSRCTIHQILMKKLEMLQTNQELEDLLNS